MGVDQGDQGDRSLAHERGESRQIVERLFWRRIEDVQSTQGGQPGALSFSWKIRV